MSQPPESPLYIEAYFRPQVDMHWFDSNQVSGLCCNGQQFLMCWAHEEVKGAVFSFFISVG